MSSWECKVTFTIPSTCSRAPQKKKKLALPSPYYMERTAPGAVQEDKTVSLLKLINGKGDISGNSNFTCSINYHDSLNFKKKEAIIK